jgi:hypothetical protein
MTDPARQAAEKALAELFKKECGFSEFTYRKVFRWDMDRCARIAADFAERLALAERSSNIDTLATHFGQDFETTEETHKNLGGVPLPWAEAMKEGA